MRYILLVHVVEAAQNLPRDVGGVFLGELFLLQNAIVELAAVHQLRDNVVVAIVFEDFMHLHETWMVGLHENTQLAELQLHEDRVLLQLALVDDLDCPLLV